MSWEPEKTVTVKIEADSRTNLSVEKLEEKIRGWIHCGYSIVRVTNLDTGEVSEKSVNINTTCIICGSVGVGCWRVEWPGSSCGPYCKACWEPRRELHQPPSEEELKRREDERLLVESVKAFARNVEKVGGEIAGCEHEWPDNTTTLYYGKVLPCVKCGVNCELTPDGLKEVVDDK